MITDISTRRGKSAVYFDGICRFTVRAADIAACGIKTGCELDPDEVLEKLAKIQFNPCYEAALTILDSCEQTRASIKRKLSLKGFIPCVCEQVCEKLIRSGLIDEERYSERMVEAQSARPVGRANVRRKLMAKGIDPDTIEDSLSVMDDAQQLAACRQAIIPLLRRYRALEPREARQKTAQALMRKGFSWDVCSTVLDENTLEE